MAKLSLREMRDAVVYRLVQMNKRGVIDFYAVALPDLNNLLEIWMGDVTASEGNKRVGTLRISNHRTRSHLYVVENMVEQTKIPATDVASSIDACIQIAKALGTPHPALTEEELDELEASRATTEEAATDEEPSAEEPSAEEPSAEEPSAEEPSAEEEAPNEEPAAEDEEVEEKVPDPEAKKPATTRKRRSTRKK